MVVVMSFVHFFSSYSFYCNVLASLQEVGDHLTSQYLFQVAPPWLVPGDGFWLSFAGKRDLAQMLQSFPFQWLLTQHRAKYCLLHQSELRLVGKGWGSHDCSIQHG